MSNYAQVLAQLRSERNRAQQELDKLQNAIHVLEQLETGRPGRKAGASRRGRFSAAARSRMAAAQRARWARAKRSTTAKPRVMSAAARRKIAAAQRARWARQKSEQKNAA